MISWGLKTALGIDLAPYVEHRVTVTLGRTNYTANPSGSVLTFQIPWRALDFDPSTTGLGEFVVLELDTLELKFVVSDIVVGPETGTVTAVRRTLADVLIDPPATGTVPFNLTRELRAAGGGVISSLNSYQAGLRFDLDAYYGGTVNYSGSAWPIAELATCELFGRIVETRDADLGLSPEPPYWGTFANASLYGLLADTGRTAISIPDSTIIRNVEATRSILTGATSITVTGDSSSHTLTTSDPWSTAIDWPTRLTRATDLETLAQDLEDAYADQANAPHEAWLPDRIVVQLDKLDDAAVDWADVVLGPLPDLDRAQPMTRVEVPVIPPTTTAGSWTAVPCFVEGATLELSRGGSTAQLYAVPEFLLRRRDVYDIVDPADIIAWFDPIQQDHITPNGSNVATLDAVYPSISVSQATASAQPDYQFADIAGRPCLDFDGTADRLVSPTITQALPFTVFSVVRSDEQTGSTRYFFGQSGTSPRVGKTSTGFWSIRNPTILTSTTSVGNSFTTAVIVAVFDGVNSELWLNGTLDTTGDTGTGTFSAESFVIGAGTSGGSQAWDGKIGETGIVAGHLTNGQIEQLSAHLAQKWGRPS